MQKFVEEQVYTYSLRHHIAIQKRNMEAMDKFIESGSTVSRLGMDDVAKFRKAALPIWNKWANKDADARRVFELQLDYMRNEILGYVTQEDMKLLSA